MNRELLQRLASDWVRFAKNDIRKKLLNFMEEVNADTREIAYDLGLSEGELQQIIEGNGEITISTFAKLLIASGFALEIKPITETPLGSYENIPNECEFGRPLPRPNVFERPKPQDYDFHHFGEPNFSNDFDIDDEDDEFEEDFTEEPILREPCRPKQPRDAHGRFMSTRHQEPRHEVPTSIFATKSKDELVKIIRERLWDTEINLNTATKNELVAFLDEKDKRMKEYKRIKELEEDPKVVEFKNRLKTTLENNPHLRDWAKKFIGDLNE